MLLLRASHLLPLSSPALEDAAVLIEGDEILNFGPYEKVKDDPRASQAELKDLGSCVLLPGFVNAHCHLELTALEGFQNPGSFTDWIWALVQRKADYTKQDIEKSFQEGIRRLILGGCTTVADHVSIGSDFSPLLQSPLRSRIILEALGVNPKFAKTLFEAGQKLEAQSIFLSPHAAHSLDFPILEKLLRSDRKFFSIHLCESAEEKEFFSEGKGKLYDFISEKNRERVHEKQASALQFLEKQGLLSDKILAIHCNYLDDEDIALLQKHQISVVHCPSSHAYFQHERFPLEKLKAAKINIALGTDSLSSGNSLSMLDQVRLAAKNYPGISKEEWLYSLTLGGAQALKMEKEIGSIEVGKKADLIAFEIKNEQDIFEAIFSSASTTQTICSGQLQLPPSD